MLSSKQTNAKLTGIDTHQPELKRILVVEDSPTTRVQIAKALEAAGFDVLTAEDGEQAIAAVFEYHPELVVLDVVLPKKNGYQVCRTIKSDPDLALKVVIATAKDQEKDRIWSGRQGADAYLSKPIDMELLVATVQRLTATGAASPLPASLLSGHTGHIRTHHTRP
ncbi:MAG: response regulator [Pirellulaceae bacterium]|nr:response regulator [Pirellulaceae bacterium]